ncbi:MAG: NmrA family NAD(P)-binding protein, partial [Myxococcaceae bacterium]
MRTLLTGATGLIGANLVRTLVRAGERPRVLLTPGSDARSLGGLDVERVSGDVRDAHSLAKAMNGVQRV